MAVERPDLDWVWLGNGAVDDFKEWRVRSGATRASAASYASGARAFVRFCRRLGLHPHDAVEPFRVDLARRAEVSPPVQSDYRSHARAFVQFLEEARPIRLSGRPLVRPASHPDIPVEERSTAATTDLLPIAASSPSWIGSLADASIGDLLAGYATTLDVLRSRGVIRTRNAPAGDYGEWLVWRAFGGTREPNSTKSHDVTDARGRKLQVKARVVSERSAPGQQQTSVFRSWDFDLLVLVQLAERDYSVVRASMIPVELFDKGRAHARWNEHERGWKVFMTTELMGHSRSVDVTTQLRQVATDA